VAEHGDDPVAYATTARSSHTWSQLPALPRPGIDFGEAEPSADEETTSYPPLASGTITPGDRDDFDP
jgi:hypothetical protein